MSKPLSVVILSATSDQPHAVDSVVATLLDELAARLWIAPVAASGGESIDAVDAVVVAVASDDSTAASAVAPVLERLHDDAYVSTPVFVVAVGEDAGRSAAVSELRAQLSDRHALLLPVSVFAREADVADGRVASASVLETVRRSVETALPFLRVDRLLVSAVEGLRRVGAGARLIDVRSNEGRDATGSVDGAEVVLKPDVEQFTDGLPRETKLVVFCGSVRGSGPVVEWLSDAGFTDVVHVDGGFSALRRAGAPTSEAVIPAAAPAAVQP